MKSKSSFSRRRWMPAALCRGKPLKGRKMSCPRQCCSTKRLGGEPVAGGERGLLAEYYNTEEGSEDFPNFPASKKPDLKRVDKDINFESTQDEWPGTHFKDFFYIRWTGMIRIPAEGAYTFYLESDDGSRMFIGGKQVLENGGAHAMQEISG